MAKKRKQIIRIGTVVQLRTPLRGKRGETPTAKVVRFYGYIPGGVVLDNPLENARSWNVAELMRAKRQR